MLKFLWINVFLVCTVFAQNSMDFIPVWTRVGDRFGAVNQENGTASIEAAEFSPNDSLIVAGSKRGGEVTCWTVDGEKLWQKKHIADPEDEVEVVTWTRDNKYALSGGENFRVNVWRVTDGEKVKVLMHNASIDGMRMSHDGTLLAAGTEAGEIVLWDTSDPDPAKWPDDPLAVIINGPDENRPGGGSGHSDINSIDWTKDDRFIVTAGRNAVVKRWEVARYDEEDQGLVQVYKGFWDSIKSNRLSPDEKYIAAGGQESPQAKVIVWDYQTGEHVKDIDISTFSKIEAVEFTPDGKFLITGGIEGKHDNNGIGKIRVYNVDMDFALVHEEVVFRQEYFDFNTDGSQLLSSHEDGTLRLWQVEYKTMPVNVFEDIRLAAGESYDTGLINKSAPLYENSIYTIEAYPDYVQDQWYVRTRPEHGFVNLSSFLSFDLVTESTLYVGYDPQASQLPAWLQDWTALNDSIRFSPPVKSSGTACLLLYGKTFPPGTVTLGGNLAPPAEGARLNYIVIGRKGRHLTAVDESEPQQPNNCRLLQNYPNPFNSTTIIRYQISAPGNVFLNVYDLTGRILTSLVSERQTTGVHQHELNANDFSSGVYVYRLVVKNENGIFSHSKKMIHIK